MSLHIVFMGTPEFAVPALRALVDAGHEVPLVVTTIVPFTSVAYSARVVWNRFVSLYVSETPQCIGWLAVLITCER